MIGKNIVVGKASEDFLDFLVESGVVEKKENQVVWETTDITKIKSYFGADAETYDWVEEMEKEGKTLKLTVILHLDSKTAEYAVGTYDPLRAGAYADVSEGVDNRGWSEDDFDGAIEAIYMAEKGEGK